jgi:hypothetical protein
VNGNVAGVVIANSSHRVVDKITKDSSGHFSMTGAGDITGYGPIIVAVSGRHQEAVFFGETTRSGQVLNQVRIFDFDVGASRIASILGSVTLVSPKAATYRLDDDSYYVLDAATFSGTQNPSMRLVRLSRGMTGEILYEWPRAGAKTSFGLSTSSFGSIIASCWSSSSYTVGELLLDPFDYLNPITQFDGFEHPAAGVTIPPRALHLRGLYNGSLGLLVAAERTSRGVQLWRQTMNDPELLPFGNNPNPPDRPLTNLNVCF